MAADQNTPIVVKRVKRKRGGGHHGGSWKIAYADFVTAMMAFFLLMWLVGSTSQSDLEGIAEYFQTPLKVALTGGSGSGDTGGGQDPIQRTTEVGKKNGMPDETQTIDLEKAREEVAKRDLEHLKALEKKVEHAILDDPKLAPNRDQIKLELTKAGLQILIVDDLHRPMFDKGRATLRDHSKDILHAIGGLLNGVDNAVSLAGHTDAAPYAGGERGYSNWELSTDRANAARRELVAGGMDASKVLRVVGLSSSLPLDPSDPLNPINRRISLMVLNEATERAIRGQAERAAVSVDELTSSSGLASGAR